MDKQKSMSLIDSEALAHWQRAEACCPLRIRHRLIGLSIQLHCFVAFINQDGVHVPQTMRRRKNAQYPDYILVLNKGLRPLTFLPEVYDFQKFLADDAACVKVGVQSREFLLRRATRRLPFAYK
jgi:hypothetical protein